MMISNAYNVSILEILFMFKTCAEIFTTHKIRKIDFLKSSLKSFLIFLIMAKIFCGVQLGIEKFCKVFGAYLAQHTEDKVIRDLIEVILFGRCQHTIVSTSEGRRSIIEYFHNDKFQFRVAQIQTKEIQQKFQTLESIFKAKFDLQLIIRKEKFLHFYVGEEIVLDVSKHVGHLQINPETQRKLRTWLGELDSTAAVYVIV